MSWKQSLFTLVTDSVKDFKYWFFYVRPKIDATKKMVVELDEKGLVVKHKFSLSWTKDHFKYEGFEYACQAKSLVVEEAQTLRMLLGWVD